MQLDEKDFNKIPEELKLKGFNFLLNLINYDGIKYIMDEEKIDIRKFFDEIKQLTKKKKIDMSVFIENDFLMQFGDLKGCMKTYGKIIKILENKKYKYLIEGNGCFKYCQPLFNHVYACPNGFDKCPIPAGFEVRLYLRDGGLIVVPRYYKLRWRKKDDLVGSTDIIAFEIIGLADSYEF